MMTEDERWLEYIYPETAGKREVLKNKFDIRDPEKLYKLEAQISFEKLVDLYQNPIAGDFDKTHLCLIHEYLFKDLYDWAGQFRKVDIEKGHSVFTRYHLISDYLDKELTRINEKVKTVMSSFSLAVVLTELYILILDIHPFREGNGRTAREFVREFALEKTKNLEMGQYELDWSKMDKKIIDDNITFEKSYRSIIELEFYKALSKVEQYEQKI